MYHKEYPYGYLSDRSDITNISSRSGPRHKKHGREVPELGSYCDSEPSTPTLYIVEDDDIDARLAALNQKLMVQSLRNITLENVECNEEKIEESKSENLLQSTDLCNRSKHDLFDEWMDSIKCLNAFVIDKPTYMKVEEEVIDDMDVGPTVLMLGEEEAYWEPPAIMEATTELKNWAQEAAVHPMDDSVRKIKTVKSFTLSKKFMTAEPVTPTKNVVVPIDSISTSVSIFVKSVCDSFPVKSVESVESVKKSFAFNMIFDSAYLLALNVFISKIGKETLNDKELKHGYLEPIKEET